MKNGCNVWPEQIKSNFLIEEDVPLLEEQLESEVV